MNKETKSVELMNANKKLVFEGKEKQKRAAELVIANKELTFQTKEKKKRADELVVANKELVFQTKEKKKRADELIIANKELIFQNKEKEKRALELLIANEELLALNEQLRNLSAHLQSAREDERTSIAREVHDELGQQMTSLRMEIAWVSNMVDGNPEIKKKTDIMTLMVKEAISSIRRIAIQLRPSILDDLGLEAALEWQSKEFEKNTRIPCKFTSIIKHEEFSTDINTTVFRIFQESLTNITRHAHATQVKAMLYEKGNSLVLKVSDNGIGINEERKVNKVSFGLMGMRERATIINGTFDINRAGKKGTVVQLRIPI